MIFPDEDERGRNEDDVEETEPLTNPGHGGAEGALHGRRRYEGPGGDHGDNDGGGAEHPPVDGVPAPRGGASYGAYGARAGRGGAVGGGGGDGSAGGDGGGVATTGADRALRGILGLGLVRHLHI